MKKYPFNYSDSEDKAKKVKMKYNVGDKIELVKNIPEYGFKKGRKFKIYYRNDSTYNPNPYVCGHIGSYMIRTKGQNFILDEKDIKKVV